MPDRMICLIVIACVLGLVIVAFIMSCCAYASGRQHEANEMEDDEQEKAISRMKKHGV